MFAFYVILCLLLLIYYYSKEKFELEKLRNKDDNETIFNLLWNGDYESTYRLAQMLIEEGKIVQPIYIQFTLENCRTSLENCKLKKRKFANKDYEIAIMNKIINKLKNNYPEIVKQDLLLPIKYIQFEELQDDKTFNNYFNELIKKNHFSELIKNKSLAKKIYIIAKYSLYNKQYIDITISPKEKRSKAFINFITKNITEITQSRKSLNGNKTTAINYQLDFPLINNKKQVYFTDKLRFPLINETNTTLAKKFTDITQLSWSCINPNSKTGNNCGKCNKCLRLIANQ